MNIPNFYIEPAIFDVDYDAIHHVRNSVFVIEQQIPADEEFDELDPQCHHVIARDGESKPIGTGRLLPEGKIGRLAVIKEWRGQGVGKSLLRALIEKARTMGLTTVTANVQVSAQGFYQQFGFVEEGDHFLEAEIPHQAMRLALEPIISDGRPDPIPRSPSVQPVRIETLESTLEACLQLIDDARRQLYIYTGDLEYNLFGQTDIVEAFRRFSLRNRNSSVQIIIQEPESLRGKTHPLLELAQRLTSHFFIRTPVEAEDLKNLSAFIVNDCDGYLFRLIGNRYEGHWSPNLPVKNRALLEEFERVWQRSEPTAEFRALGL